MRQNKTTAIVGEKVILVPYKREHVERYHEWMKDAYLQGKTSEMFLGRILLYSN
jgi:hypothetical protein